MLYIVRCSYIWCVYVKECCILIVFITLSLYNTLHLLLKTVLSYMNIPIPIFLVFSFTWIMFFHPLVFSPCVSLTLKWVSCKQHRDRWVLLCFVFIHELFVFWLKHLLHQLTFEMIIDRNVFISICYLFPGCFCSCFLL